MATPGSKASLGKKLQTVTDETGSAVIRCGQRTFVVVEVEQESIQSPPDIYDVTSPEEAAALKEALDDANNPSYTTTEALAYLRDRRGKRLRRGDS